MENAEWDVYFLHYIMFMCMLQKILFIFSNTENNSNFSSQEHGWESPLALFQLIKSRDALSLACVNMD